MATNRSGEPGKQDFVKKVLEQDRDANVTIVNQAWREAGKAGTISRSLVGLVRREMGLTSGRPTPGKTASAAESTATRTRKTRKTRTRPTSGSPAQDNGAITSPGKTAGSWDLSVSSQARPGVYEELEADLDRILFRVMSLGTMPEVERLIRHCRRFVILASGQPG